MNLDYPRLMFLSGAVFNTLAGLLLLLVAMGPAADIMGFEITPTATLFIQVMGGVVLAFAWAYWKISTDPVLYRPYILLGLCLKIMVVVIVFGHWLAGNLLWPFPALVSGDILYAFLFWRYYQLKN